MYYIYVPVLLRYMQLVPRNEKVKACKTKTTESLREDMKKATEERYKHAVYALFYITFLYLKVGHDGG